jgi:hypothetical protein
LKIRIGGDNQLHNLTSLGNNAPLYNDLLGSQREIFLDERIFKYRCTDAKCIRKVNMDNLYLIACLYKCGQPVGFGFAYPYGKSECDFARAEKLLLMKAHELIGRPSEQILAELEDYAAREPDAERVAAMCYVIAAVRLGLIRDDAFNRVKKMIARPDGQA